MQQADKKLVFENGTVLYGHGFGADTDKVCEVVLNTAMVGYQEIFSDSSYFNQMVCMAYPMIGNYGMADEDYEARVPRIGGMIVREYNDSLANFRAAKTLAGAMEEYGIPGISGVDTRRIAHMLRREGPLRANLCNALKPDQNALAQLAATPAVCQPVAQVSCKKKWYARAAGVQYHVVAIDCGIRNSMIASLKRRKCNITVVPYNTPAEEIAALAPDGLFVGNGPGNPMDVPEVVDTIKTLQGKMPLFGVCLGHQLIALAGGCTVSRLPIAHRGANHPVQNLATGKIETSHQNHSFVVDADSVMGSGLKITHRNVLDESVEGLYDKIRMILSVQYHPEPCAHAQDSAYLYDQFIAMMDAAAKGGTHYA